MSTINKNMSIKKIFAIYIKTRLVLLTLMIFASFILPSTSALYKTIFELFDNEHYLNIAKNAYQFNYQYAFFPLTAILIKILSPPGFIIINQLFVFLTGYLLYLLSKNIFQAKNPYFASLLWLVSPISVFTGLFYSEALFVFLTLLAYYLYKNKKHYFALGVILGLSTLTRSLGSMLFTTIFIFMVLNMFKKKEKFKNILITYIPATIISCLYPIYLFVKIGNPLYFVSVQFDYWSRISTNVFTIFFDSFKVLLKIPNLFYIFNFGLTFILIGYIIYSIIKHRRNKNYYDLYLYITLTIISICSTIRGTGDPTTSFYRYLYGCFPIYFILPQNKPCLYTHIILSTFITISFLLGLYFF